jgi:N-acetylglucosamine kinase-like BadF-type ATPase
MTNELILAIDGGATRTRCLVIDRDGRVLGRGDAGPSNHLLIDHDSVRRSLSTAMDRALASAGLSKSAVRCAAAGLAGVDYDGAGADAARRLVDGVGPAVVAIEGDAVIAHLAALGGCPGVVALAGTGSNILGIAADGTRVKAGGWGPLYGNEGSAHGIARQALVAAARAYDGLGPRTALVPAILQRFGLREFRETLQAIYGAGRGISEVAALAPLVEDAAEGGDDVAREILVRAGTDLAEGVAVVIDRLGLEQQHRLVSYQGAVLQSCAAAREAFVRALSERVEGIRVEAPMYEPIIGAYMLGRRALNWPAVDFQLEPKLHERL